MRVLMIIPAYNEEESILQTVQQIESYREFCDFTLDYVIINDGSTDKTQEILDRYEFNHVQLVLNLGIGGAVQTGYKYALENGYDIAVQFDGDGQHDICSLKELITNRSHCRDAERRRLLAHPQFLGNKLGRGRIPEGGCLDN